jgi:hypothetical protein
MRTRHNKRSSPNWEHKKYQEAGLFGKLLAELASLRRDERDRADYNKLGWERAAAWAACLEAKFAREFVDQTWAVFYAERLAQEREQAIAEGWGATFAAQQLVKEQEAAKRVLGPRSLTRGGAQRASKK